MEFPTLLYRVPGEHRLSGDQTFAWIGALDQDAADTLLADGWFASIKDALAGAEPADEVDSSERATLEAEAKTLGVSFNWKTSDAVLSERVAAKKAQ